MSEQPPAAPEGAPQRRSLMRRAFTPVGAGERGEGPSSPEQRKQAFRILFLSLTCLGVGQSGMFAILPPVSRELGLTEFQTGAIFAISATIWVFSSAFWGARSDRQGRRPMIVLGLSAFSISMFAFATSVEIGLMGLLPIAIVYPMMIASRSIYGIFGSAGFPAAQGYIADRTSPTERTSAVASLNAAFGLGTTAGPGIIAALAVMGTIAPLYFIAAVGAISAFAIWRFLPERTAPVMQAKDKSQKLSWRDGRILPFLIFGVLLGTAGSFPIQVIAYFFMDVLKLDTAQAIQFSGVGLMASSMAALFAQLVIVQRMQMTAGQLVQWGIGIGFASYVLFVVGETYGLIVFALLLSGLGFGLIRPGYGAAVSLAVGKEQQGAAAGLTGGATASGFIFAPLVGNWLYAYDPHYPFYLGGVMMIVMAIYVALTPQLRTLAGHLEDDNAETNVPKV
jgi:MFS family permease